MFTVKFDLKSKRNMYEQLYHFIKDEMIEGRILPHQKLPSKRKLADHLKISQNTVALAYEQLLAEGYVMSRPKSGYYACPIDLLSPKGQLVVEHEWQRKESKQEYLYDFVVHAVDMSFFPFDTWGKLTRTAMRYDQRHLLELGDAQGDLQLRESIAAYLHEFRGVNCLPEQIIIGAGTEHLLGLIVHLLGNHLTFAIENPGYDKTGQFLRCHQVAVNPIDVDVWGMSVAQLKETKAQVAYVTPSHQFPTGAVMPISRRIQLLNWANEEDSRYIIEDDYDCEFRFAGRPIPALQGLDQHDKVIYLNTFSKSIAPSLRIGYIVLPQPLLSKFTQKLMFFSSTVSRFEQMTLQMFIEDGYYERHLHKIRKIYQLRKQALIKALAQLPSTLNIKIEGEDAGLHLLVKIHNRMSEAQLVDAAKAVGVRVYGISAYHWDESSVPPQSTLLLGYASLAPEQIHQAVSLLGKAWGI